MLYKSTVVIERIDSIIMAGGSPTIDPPYFMSMVAEALECKMEQVWRVSFYDNGKVDLYSFAMPLGEKNLPIADRLNDQSLLPSWVQERIAVLQICEQGDIVDGVGQKVSDKVFYVIQ